VAGRTVAVTGVSGWVGRSLLGLLERDPSVDRIIGVDTVEIPIRTAKLEFHTFDVRDPALGELIAGADVVVHLAFCVDPMRDAALMHDVNVGGFRNVLDAVAAAGVTRVVYPSSAFAYGAHPDNPVPIDETQPLRPNTSFPYAAHKAETESLLERWQELHPDVAVTVLRFAMVLGPHVDNFMTRRFEPPLSVAVAGHRPPLQVLHEDDAAAAVAWFVAHPHPGVFNVAADGTVDWDTVVAAVGTREVALPADVLFPLADVASAVGLIDTAPGELTTRMYPIVVDTSRVTATGWAPTHGALATVTATVAAHRDRVSFGPLHTDRAGLRHLVAVALRVVAAVVAAVAGSALVRTVTRRVTRRSSPGAGRR
jgi:UDP-glucose 4-epimerase